MTNQPFREWLSRHGCSRRELWLMQNMLGSCLGWEHPLRDEVLKAYDELVAANPFQSPS